LRKHNCFGLSGLPKGKLYCQELFDYDDAWTIETKFSCFTKYNVNFGKEYCDNKFPSMNRFLLMQCYATREVEKGQEFCDSNFDMKKETDLWKTCYE
jgi:hypothetical protein